MSSWVVPGYAEERELGRGASGHVVAAVHVATGTRVAIKYLAPRLLADARFLAAFRAEAQLLRSLSDPHVVRLLDYVEEPGPAGVDRGPPPGVRQGAAIVMELVGGVSLHEMITGQGPTSAESALLVLKGSLLGLAAAHALGIVHRDYKPENVLVDADGTSKLTDFGVAARAGHDAPAGGTPYYMAPEQWDGTPATPAADIYAATAVFFECLTGLTPFSGSLPELLAQHAAAAVPVAMVDEPLRALIARGMAKDPAARPANAAELVTELEATAAAAYGPAWEDRGRAQLAERAAALLLLLLHGSATAAAGGTGTTTTATTLTSKAATVSASTASHGGLGGWAMAATYAAAFVVVAGAVAGAVVGVGALASSKHPATPKPPVASSAVPAAAPTAPSLLYATATSVDLRSGNGTVRTLATFPKNPIGGGFGDARLAWSADGSKVAWLANSEVGELRLDRDQVHEWHCNCTSIVFRGEQLISDGSAAGSAPVLLSYPDDGSKPTSIAISGLPKSQFAGGLNDWSLEAGISPADVIVGYGTDVAAAGGPQLLYRVDASGRAVPFGSAASQVSANGVPGFFTLSPDGSQVSFLLHGDGGVCADTNAVVVASTATGAETHPALPAGLEWATATWFGPSGTLYASVAPIPPGCPNGGGTTLPSVVTSPEDYRLQAGTWVRTGSGIVTQQTARSGWVVTLYGSITSTGVGADTVSSSLKLVLSNGRTSVTVPGAVAFLWGN